MLTNFWFWTVVIAFFIVVCCLATDKYYAHFYPPALPVIPERPPYWTNYQSPGTGRELPSCACCKEYFAIGDKLLVFPTDEDDLFYCYRCTKVNHES